MRLLRGILVLLLAIVSLPLTILYFALRLAFGSKKAKPKARLVPKRDVRAEAFARVEREHAARVAAVRARRAAARS